MALTEETLIGKVEIVGTDKAVQVRTDTVIKRDDVAITMSHFFFDVSLRTAKLNKAKHFA